MRVPSCVRFRTSDIIGNSFLQGRMLHGQIEEQSSSCLMDVAQVCQVAIGDALLWPTWPNLEDLASRFEHIPGAASYREATLAMATLLQFTQGLGTRIHRRVHSEDPAGACAFNPSAHFVPARIDPAKPEAWMPGAAMRAWAKDFDHAFSRAHQRTVSERAREQLRGDLVQGRGVTALAREVGCSVAVLQRRFAEESGETLTRYRARMRTAMAIERLRDTDWKVEAVARDVGWKSKKDLYRTLDGLTGLTPAAVRTLPRSEVDRIVARLGGAN
jgi:AraC-like DNA-binding protein